MGSQSFDFFFFFLLKRSTGSKNCVTQMKFGTDKVHIDVNSCTKFAMNLINFHGAKNVYPHKKIKINSLWE